MDETRPRTLSSAQYALTNYPVRHLTVPSASDGAVDVLLVDAEDVCRVVGVDADAAFNDLLASEWTYVSVEENGAVVGRRLLTPAGVVAVVRPDEDPERARFHRWIETELRAPRAGRRAPNPNRTKWGWQPLREVMRERGYTARRFTEEANALDLPVGRFNQGNLIAWAYGGCLPAESLVARACELLQVHPADLFNPDVLAAYPHRGKGRHRHPASQPQLPLGEDA